jgi:pyrroline-5-carboxylate reductase
VIERVGIIGVGHLTGYLVEGLRRATPDFGIILSPRNVKMSARLATRFGATVAADNQAVADGAELILVTTRPGDVVAACEAITFRADQTVVSTAAGVQLEVLKPAVAPAQAVRAMPLTCAAINRSPTLLHPDHSQARSLFEPLGSVLAVDNEAQFTAASAIAAFYGWVYALLDQGVAWTVQAGVPLQTARSLVLETARGASEMGLSHGRGHAGGFEDFAREAGLGSVDRRTGRGARAAAW